MRAVILAAGRGGRLRGVVGKLPKCLARIGDCSILERQIASLRAAGIDRITVVTGFGADAVGRVCGRGVDLVHNARFATTNSLYSLWLVRDLLAEGFLVLNCDVLFHPRLLAALLEARYEDALLVCARGEQAAYSEEEMKVCVRRGLVTAIDKELGPDEADGENIGIAKFGAAGAAVLVEELNALVASGAAGAWVPRAFAAFCGRRALHVVESDGYPWIEIDFPEDYWRACSEILPAIEHFDAPRLDLTRAVGGTSSGHTATPVAASRSGRTFRHV